MWYLLLGSPYFLVLYHFICVALYDLCMISAFKFLVILCCLGRWLGSVYLSSLRPHYFLIYSIYSLQMMLLHTIFLGVFYFSVFCMVTYVIPSTFNAFWGPRINYLKLPSTEFTLNINTSIISLAESSYYFSLNI